MHTAHREVTFEEFLIPASDFADAATPSFKLCLVLEGEADLSYRLGDRAVTPALRPGMFAPVTPPSMNATLGISHAQRHLMIEIGAAALRRAADDAGHPATDLGVLHDRPFRSPFLTQLSTQALREHRSGDGLGASFVDAMQDVFMLTLLRVAHGGRSDAPRPPPALPDVVIETIRRYCLDRLGRARDGHGAGRHGRPGDPPVRAVVPRGGGPLTAAVRHRLATGARAAPVVVDSAPHRRDRSPLRLLRSGPSRDDVHARGGRPAIALSPRDIELTARMPHFVGR